MKKKLPGIIAAVFLLIISSMIVLKLFFIEARMIKSNSMQPTLMDGDYILSLRMCVKRAAVTGSNPDDYPLRRNDIIVFKLPGEREELVKRIIGLPGESVELSPGSVLIDGKSLTVIGNQYSGLNSDTLYRIPKDSVFVLGDNLNSSRDSRSFGFVRIGDIRERVFFRYYPLDRFGFVR